MSPPAPPRPAGGVSTFNPAFSYAQAAKGRSVSVPSTVAKPVPAKTTACETSTVEAKTPKPAPSPSAATPEPTRRTDESHGAPEEIEPRAAVVVEETTPPRSSSVGELRTTQESSLTTRAPPLQSLTASSSPTLGARSAPPQAKDEDAQSLPNVPSDAVWDKQSQRSTSADETGEHDAAKRGRRDGRDEFKDRWAPLVAAPIPTVNIWQQRKEAQAAKLAAQSSSAAHAASRTLSSDAGPPAKVVKRRDSPEGERPSSKVEGEQRGPAASTEPGESQTGTELAPQETRDRGRVGGVDRSRDEAAFKKPYPRARGYPEREKEKGPSVSLRPPPVADSSSWPTPDIAKDESKKKAQERTERAEKDRVQVGQPKTHGKEKWTPVPYTPSVVFETPVTPPRPSKSGRTGRDNGRAVGGGPPPNGNMRADRVSSSSVRGQPVGAGGVDDAVAPGSRNRVDVALPKVSSPVDPGPKRAMSAGPHGGREQRRSNPPGSPEKRRESDLSPKHPERKWNVPARRTSSATQTDDVSGSRHETRANGRSDAVYPQTQPTSGPDRGRPLTYDAPHGYPRPPPYDRRGDVPSRIPEHGRDLGQYAAGRDRGEARSDRGRAGLRNGRGAHSGGGGGGGGSSATHYHQHHHHQHHHQPPALSNGGSGGAAAVTTATTSSTVASHTGTPQFGSGAAGLIAYQQHQRHQPYQQPTQPTQSHQDHQPSGGHANAGVARLHGRRNRSGSPPRPSHASFGRYAAAPGAPPPMAQIQTQMRPVFEYQGLQAMSAIPYSPFVEQYSVLSMVSMQMDYYFSVDNLCKDMFLRKHMDSFGFVYLSFIANFNRIRQLTQDFELLRYACFTSRTVEFYQPGDGVDRVRRREGWQQWVLATDERDPSIRNVDMAYGIPIPPELMAPIDDRAQERTNPSASSVESVSHVEAVEAVPPVEAGPRVQAVPPVEVVPHNEAVPHAERSEAEPSADQSNGATLPASDLNAPAPVSNGVTNGGPSTSKPTPLTAAVPDFSPVTPFPGFRDEANPMASTATDAFSDEQVDSLMMVIRDPKLPRPAATSQPVVRSFSNGSVDEKTIAEAFGNRQSRSEPWRASDDSPINDSSRRGSAQRPGSSLLPPPQGKGMHEIPPPPVLWMKDRETPIESFPDGLIHQSYNHYRKIALDQRRMAAVGSCPDDMNLLYDFWSHFLVRNFNTRMYEEFRGLALEDHAQRATSVGLTHLIQYYDVSLNSQTTITDKIAKDYVELVEGESDKGEPIGYPRLRSAWRNGALNLKNRKKIDSFLSAALKAKLDR